MGTTPNLALPYPEPTDAPDGAAQIKALAEKVDTVATDGTLTPTLDEVATAGATTDVPIVLEGVPGDQVALTIKPAGGAQEHVLEVYHPDGTLVATISFLGRITAARGTFSQDVRAGEPTGTAVANPRVMIRDTTATSVNSPMADGISLHARGGRLEVYNATSAGGSGSQITDWVLLAPSADADNALTLGSDKGLFVDRSVISAPTLDEVLDSGNTTDANMVFEPPNAGATTPSPIVFKNPVGGDGPRRMIQILETDGSPLYAVDRSGSVEGLRGNYRSDIRVGGTSGPAQVTVPRIMVRDKAASAAVPGTIEDGFVIAGINGRMNVYTVTGTGGSNPTDWVQVYPSADADNAVTLGSDKGFLVKKAAAQADSTATDVAGLVADFNSLLAKLRAAGLLAT